jgi:nucleotide-binding universal stress UspA family protein
MTVVVGYVPDQTGYLAVTEALNQAKLRESAIVVVNVVPHGSFATPTAADELDVDALSRRLEESGVEFEIRHRVEGTLSISEEILAAAEDAGAELIVVGLRRRSPVGKALLGSTAQQVILSATCPVLSVKHD